MFGLLKNKLANFISGLTGREEKKGAPSQEKPPVEEKIKIASVASEEKKEVSKEIHKEAPKEMLKEVSKPVPEAQKTIQKPVHESPKTTHEAPEPTPEAAKTVSKPSLEVVAPPSQKKSVLESVLGAFSGAKTENAAEQKTESTAVEAPSAEAKKEAAPKPGEKKAEKTPVAPKREEKKKAEKTKPASPALESSVEAQKVSDSELARLEKHVSSDKHGMAPKIGIGTAIRSFFSSEITIGESEVTDLLEELEMSLLEADVAYEVSFEVSSQLKSRLVGMKVPKGQVEQRTRDTIRNVLESVMDSDRKFDFVQRVKGLPRPVKVLFVGPNGAGKTTTMAKMARMLMDNGLTVVLSASDTFRAAAIEQTEVHGERLGVKVVKSKYGADPASVAFDAVSYARAHGIDVVLIDSAGRQDTNANLLSELKKINRVAQPDLKIYIGESIGGNAVIEQIRAFNEAIGIDGAILTKIDCDAKGGTAISIAKTTGIPVLFLGIGQGYSDLVPFEPHKVAQEIMT